VFEGQVGFGENWYGQVIGLVVGSEQPRLVSKLEFQQI
jgi:hypothetical protein